MKHILSCKEVENISERIINGEFLSDIADEKGLFPHTILVNIWANKSCFERLSYEAFKANLKLIKNNDEKIKVAALKEFRKLHQDSIEVLGLIDEIDTGVTIQDIAKVKFVSKSTIYKKIEKVGFKYSKTLNKWIHPDNEEHENINLFLKAAIVEEQIELLAESRYEFDEGIFYDSIKMVDVGVYEPIFKEFELKARQFGIEYVEEIITLALLKYLDSIDPKQAKEPIDEEE